MAKREKRPYLVELQDEVTGNWQPFGKPDADWDSTLAVLKHLRDTRAEGLFRVIQVCATRRQKIETDVRVIVTEG